MARKPKSTGKSGGRPTRVSVVPATQGATGGSSASAIRPELPTHRRPLAMLDTRVIYCGDCLVQLQRLPDACIDLSYIDPPFNSNRNYEVFWGAQSEPRAAASGNPIHAADRHASTAAYIDSLRPRCVELPEPHGSNRP
jgi:hypothetical protein